MYLPFHPSLIKANSIAKDEDKEVIREQLDILVRVVHSSLGSSGYSHAHGNMP